MGYILGVLRRAADAVARVLGRNDVADLGREVRLTARMLGRWSFSGPGRPSIGGAYAVSLGALRFVLWPQGLAGNGGVVHPPALTIMLGPWRQVTVRVGRYSLFVHLRGEGDAARFGYVRVWRYTSLPAHVRDSFCRDSLTRRDLGLFPMLWRVGPADLPVPLDPCADCGESFPCYDLEYLDRDGAAICYECHEALLEADAMDRHDRDSGEWDEYMSARIDSWDEVYA